jgi:hypothetical protein
MVSAKARLVLRLAADYSSANREPCRKPYRRFSLRRPSISKGTEKSIFAKRMIMDGGYLDSTRRAGCIGAKPLDRAPISSTSTLACSA